MDGDMDRDVERKVAYNMGIFDTKYISPFDNLSIEIFIQKNFPEISIFYSFLYILDDCL